jgi:hypothetical protein
VLLAIVAQGFDVLPTAECHCVAHAGSALSGIARKPERMYGGPGSSALLSLSGLQGLPREHVGVLQLVTHQCWVPGSFHPGTLHHQVGVQQLMSCAWRTYTVYIYGVYMRM